MRKFSFVLLLIILSIAMFIPAHAAPAPQFAGCADEADEPFAARLLVKGVRGLTFKITVVGLEDFDPAITVKDAAGEIVTCNNDSKDAALVAVTLPTITTEAAETSARVSVSVPGDQGALDYEVLVTGADQTGGEFVLWYEGAEVNPSDDTDRFEFLPTESQLAAEAPLAIYAVNIKRPQLAISPELTVKVGDNFTQTCSQSSSKALCRGEHEDLSAFTLTDEEGREIKLFGADSMLSYVLGGNKVVPFEIEVGSYQDATFGAYSLLIHSAVVYTTGG
jgi:hypothetical protein